MEKGTVTMKENLSKILSEEWKKFSEAVELRFTAEKKEKLTTLELTMRVEFCRYMQSICETNIKFCEGLLTGEEIDSMISAVTNKDKEQEHWQTDRVKSNWIRPESM